MKKEIIALDADGVLLDYNLAYASAWQQAFGRYPAEKDANAYWAQDRWDVDRLSGERLDHFRRCFDASFWSNVPAASGALEACHALVEAGYDLVCVTALPEKYARARQDNLSQLGFPISKVFATDHTESDRSPKADALQQLRPVAFVDDYLPYMAGVADDIHLALVTRETNGSPNQGLALGKVGSQHPSLLEFSRWWVQRVR